MLMVHRVNAQQFLISALGPLLTMQAHLAKAFLGKTKADRTF